MKNETKITKETRTIFEVRPYVGSLELCTTKKEAVLVYNEMGGKDNITNITKVTVTTYVEKEVIK